MDPLSALSIASSVAQFVELGFKVCHRLAEYHSSGTKDLPKSFQSINIRLPLLIKSLVRVKSNAEVERLDIDTRCVLRGVVAGCSTIVSKIEDVLNRISKQPGQSLAIKLTKALRSFKADEMISSLDQDLQTYISLLILHHVVERSELNHLRADHVSRHFVVKTLLSDSGKRIKREKLLEELHSAASGVSLIEKPRYILLYGPEAVGKTQLALQYAHDAYRAEHYSNVFWLDASSPEILLLGLQNIAEIITNSKLGDQSEKLRIVKDFFESSINPWLLVFDNCQEDSLSKIDDLLPYKGKGIVLITAREQLQLDGLTIRVLKFLTSEQQKEMREKITSAITHRDLEFIKDSLTTDLDINFQCDSFLSGKLGLVNWAADCGFQEALFALLDHGANPNLIEHNLAVVGNIGCAKYDHAPSVMSAYLDWEDQTGYRAKDENYHYAIRYALRAGNLEIPPMLFDRRGVDLENREAQEGIVLAAENGKLEALQMLERAGKLPKGQILTRALCTAIQRGQLPVVKFLVEAGAPINKHDDSGYTPLLRATNSHCTDEFVKYLLEKGASTKLTHYHYKTTPIGTAADERRISAIKILLSYGADPSVEDKNGDALYHASTRSLTEAYPLLTAIDSESHQDYYVRGSFRAAKTGDRDLLLSVWDKVKDKNARNNDGDTPLLVAIKKELTPVSLLLLRKGAGADVKDKDQMSPWLLAAQKGMHQLIRWMIDNKCCSLEEPDSKGNTAFMLAMENDKNGSHGKTIMLLVEAGADQQATNNYGDTAEDIAEAKASQLAKSEDYVIQYAGNPMRSNQRQFASRGQMPYRMQRGGRLYEDE